VQELVSSDDPALMAGFLLQASAHPKAKVAAKPAAQKAAPARRAKP
jgi:hypothetical protein